MSQQNELSGGELILGVGVAAGAIWAWRNRDAIGEALMVASQATALEQGNSFALKRANDPDSFDQWVIDEVELRGGMKFDNIPAWDFLQSLDLNPNESLRIYEKMYPPKKCAKCGEQYWLGSCASRVCKPPKICATCGSEYYTRCRRCDPKSRYRSVQRARPLKSAPRALNAAPAQQVLDARLRDCFEELHQREPKMTLKGVIEHARSIARPIFNPPKVKRARAGRPGKVSLESAEMNSIVESVAGRWYVALARLNGFDSVPEDLRVLFRESVHVKKGWWRKAVTAEFPAATGDSVRAISQAVYSLNRSRLNALEHKS